MQFVLYKEEAFVSFTFALHATLVVKEITPFPPAAGKFTSGEPVISIFGSGAGSSSPLSPHCQQATETNTIKKAIKFFFILLNLYYKNNKYFRSFTSIIRIRQDETIPIHP